MIILNRQGERLNVARAIAELLQETHAEGDLERIRNRLDNIQSFLGDLVEALHTERRLPDSFIEERLPFDWKTQQG